jgi:phosphatidate cytidylyltransferase
VLPNGKYLIYLIFLAAFITDAMAYFVGTAIGKHKFAPHISPNKTLEGAIGGVVGGGLGFLVFGYCMEYIFLLEPNYLYLFLFGIISAIVAEIGDLAASAIKRQFSIKDYGDIMPGHGGVMDRFDSVLFVAPFVYLVLINFKILL